MKDLDEVLTSFAEKLKENKELSASILKQPSRQVSKGGITVDEYFNLNSYYTMQELKKQNKTK